MRRRQLLFRQREKWQFARRWRCFGCPRCPLGSGVSWRRFGEGFCSDCALRKGCESGVAASGEESWLPCLRAWNGCRGAGARRGGRVRIGVPRIQRFRSLSPSQSSGSVIACRKLRSGFSDLNFLCLKWGSQRPNPAHSTPCDAAWRGSNPLRARVIKVPRRALFRLV
jgi:hypothetical protein